MFSSNPTPTYILILIPTERSLNEPVAILTPLLVLPVKFKNPLVPEVPALPLDPLVPDVPLLPACVYITCVAVSMIEGVAGISGVVCSPI